MKNQGDERKLFIKILSRKTKSAWHIVLCGLEDSEKNASVRDDYIAQDVDLHDENGVTGMRQGARNVRQTARIKKGIKKIFVG
jgi:hypothetical protein